MNVMYAYRKYGTVKVPQKHTLNQPLEYGTVCSARSATSFSLITIHTYRIQIAG